MDLLNELNAIWVDCVCSFLMLSFLFFVACQIRQHYKSKREQKAIIANYERNLKILQNLKNRF